MDASCEDAKSDPITTFVVFMSVSAFVGTIAPLVGVKSGATSANEDAVYDKDEGEKDVDGENVAAAATL